MSLSVILQYWAVAFALAMTPGPDWAYAIATGLRARTKRSIVPAIAGMVAGYAIVVVLIVIGLGALIAAVPQILSAIALTGACYLAWLGSQALRAPASPLAVGDAGLGSDGLSMFVKGAGVSGINPKGLLLLLALLPQFVRPGGWPVSTQMALLGSIHLLDCAVVYFLVALAARRLLAARPAAAAVVTRLSGVLMIAIAAGVLAEQARALI